MSAIHKQMYTSMKQEVKRLESILNNEQVIPTEIPKDFNQNGFDLTITAVEKMLEKMKLARDNKGKRMTPQFFKSIFNRTILADVDLNKFLEQVTPTDENIDYQAESIKLTAVLYDLQQKVAAKEAEQEPKQDGEHTDETVTSETVSATKEEDHGTADPTPNQSRRGRNNG